MELQEKEQLVELAKQKIAAREVSQATVAKLTGISKTNLSFILSEDGKWKDKVIHDAQWQKLSSWLNITTEGTVSWVTVETRNYKRIFRICQDAASNRIMIALSGSQGTGKSHAFKSYQDKHPRNTYYLECREFWSKKDFLLQLKKAFGMEIYPCSITEHVDDIKNFLINRKENPLVIIDEADKLKEGVFYILKDFYDITHKRCGWVVCGGNYLKKRMEKGVRLCKQNYQELFSRMGNEFVGMHPIDDKTIENICIANGVEEKQAILEVVNSAENDLRRVERRIHNIKFIQTLNTN